MRWRRPDAEIVTVALRRADLTGRKDPFANIILRFIPQDRYLLLPNTSGAIWGMRREAVRLARLAVDGGPPRIG